MIKIYELIGGLRCVEITATITPTRRIERLEGWIGAHIRNMLLAATNEVECEGYGSLMDRVNHFPIEDSTHPWYKELKGGFPKGYVVKVLSPKQRTYELDIEHGEAIDFSITLIGSLSEYAPKIIKAIEIFAERGILCRMELTIDAVVQRLMLLTLKRRATKDTMIFDGLVGHTEWSGDVTQLYPLLKFCSDISLGEDKAYGMGDFRVE